MASVMAIGSEVIGECVEEIRIEVGRRDIEDCFGVSCGLAIRRSVPLWVCHQVALMEKVPGIGGRLIGLLV